MQATPRSIGVSAVRPVSSGLALAGLVAFAGACDRPTPAEPDAEAAALAAIAAAAEHPPVWAKGRPTTLDERLAHIAELAPGFGGVYYDRTGTPVIHVTDLARAGAAKAAVARLLRDSPWIHGAPPRDAVVVQGDFDFRDLSGWRTALNEDVLFMRGVVFTDVDEVRNRVRIAVSDASLEREIRAVARRRGVPDAAVLVERHAPFLPRARRAGRRASAFADGDSLTSRFAAVPGGVQIANDRFQECTSGFNAYKTRYLMDGVSGDYETTQYLVINGHCTMQIGGVENSAIYQPSRGAGNQIGVEVREPPWDHENSACPAQAAGCSLAEAALVRYTGARPWQFARIARPIDSVHFGPGEPLVDSRRLRFIVHDSTQNSGSQMAGARVHKIGIATAWTYGTVVDTCFDQTWFGTTLVLRCQDSADGTLNEGDSGSPVLIRSGTRNTLAGLAWGGSDIEIAYSPYVYVRWELTRVDYDAQCGGIWRCWVGLRVSGT